ncbi:Uncharacterized protein FKW44_007582, partial [Caligus rogercresseyi]
FEYAHQKESKHDMHLRKFEFSKALDSVLRLFCQKKHPEITYGVFKELKRKVLTSTIAGRDEKSIGLILQFVLTNLNKTEYSSLAYEIIEVVSELYADKIGTYPSLEKAFSQIRKKIDKEVSNVRTLLEIKSSLQMIHAAAKTPEPELRYEENEIRLANKGKKSNTLSKAPMAWEKMLLDT